MSANIWTENRVSISPVISEARDGRSYVVLRAARLGHIKGLVRRIGPYTDIRNIGPATFDARWLIVPNGKVEKLAESL